MRHLKLRAAYVAKHPGAFALGVLRAFRANQGLLLAGAIAYYTLLSIMPLLILMLIALSHIVEQAQLLATLARYLEWLIPGQSTALIGELARFLEHRDVIGWFLLATMVFFSSLAFTVLENAMSVIFLHSVVIRRRHFLESAITPYCTSYSGLRLDAGDVFPGRSRSSRREHKNSAADGRWPPFRRAAILSA